MRKTTTPVYEVRTNTVTKGYVRKTPYKSMKYEPTLLKRATCVAQKKAMYIRSA